MKAEDYFCYMFTAFISAGLSLLLIGRLISTLGPIPRPQVPVFDLSTLNESTSLWRQNNWGV